MICMSIMWSCGGGGVVNINMLNVRVLLYADDVILISSDPMVLQMMIDRLIEYCIKWNLVVNLDKLKLMVLENCKFNRNTIEVVNRYRCLGITLTPLLSMVPHLKDRTSIAKFIIHNIRSNLLRKTDISISSKWKMFNSVSRAVVVTYGAQVCGYQGVEALEKFQRFVLNYIFRLPSFTPNYGVYLETGVDLMWQ